MEINEQALKDLTAAIEKLTAAIERIEALKPEDIISQVKPEVILRKVEQGFRNRSGGAASIERLIDRR